MSRKQIRLFKGFWLLPMCVAFLYTAETHAAAYVKWCAKWPSIFTDAGGSNPDREDIYYTTSQVDRSARYSEVGVYEPIGSSERLVATKHLIHENGGRYCTSSITISSPGMYRFKQRTRLRRSNREITIATDYTTFSFPTPQTFTFEIDIPWTTGTHIIDAPITTPTKYTSMAAVATRLMELGPTLDWPDDPFQGIIVKMNPDRDDSTYGCPNDQYMGHFYFYPNPTAGGYGTCIRSSTAGVKKFVAGHELGHVIAHMEEPGQSIRGLLPSRYSADCVYGASDTPNCPGLFTPDPGPCRYSGITTRGHQMQSREYVQTAIGESFAHFTASVLFNNRETGATFNHRKGLWVGDESGSWENHSHLLHWDNRDPQQWLVNYCEPPSYWPKGFGTERDWAPFFWQIWAHGTETTRFDVTEIIDVFAGTNPTYKCCTDQLVPGSTTCRDPDIVGGKRECYVNEELFKMGRFWDDLVATMAGQGHSTLKRDFFTDMGSANGLNY